MKSFKLIVLLGIMLFSLFTTYTYSNASEGSGKTELVAQPAIGVETQNEMIQNLEQRVNELDGKVNELQSDVSNAESGFKCITMVHRRCLVQLYRNPDFTLG